MTNHILGTEFNYQNFVPVGADQKMVICLRKLQIVENLGFYVSFD